MSVTSVELQEQYTIALRSYLAGEWDIASQDVYELGRRAITDGLGILDVATIHNEALAAILVDTHRQCLESCGFGFFASSRASIVR